MSGDKHGSEPARPVPPIKSIPIKKGGIGLFPIVFGVGLATMLSGWIYVRNELVPIEDQRLFRIELPWGPKGKTRAELEAESKL